MHGYVCMHIYIYIYIYIGVKWLYMNLFKCVSYMYVCINVCVYAIKYVFMFM